MAQTVTVSSKTLEQILARLDSLTREVKAIKAKLFAGEPPYGSDVWWKKEEAEADEDIRKGRVVELKSVKDLDKPLSELFP